VAEHALALALLLMKGISPMIESLQKGAWSQAESVARGIAATRSSTLGIVGMGAVGSALAAMSRPVFAEVGAAGHGEGRTGAVDVRSVPLSDLLVRADVVVVSASWRAGRPPLIGPSEVASMGPSACLVNVARAALIDEGAVLDAVWSGGLGGFATDVPRGEPHLDDPRLRHPQVIVTPHIAGRDSGAIEMMNRCCVTNIRSLSCDGGGAELVGLVDQG
jgi:D-3-phosphoglycerate dehydrogenase